MARAIMSRRLSVAGVVVSFIVMPVGACGSESGAITVFAAASTTRPLTEIARQYRYRTGVDVRLQFAGSSTLARHISAGAPADVYLSANAAWMDYLQERGLIQGSSRTDLLSNTMVLIAPHGRGFDVEMNSACDSPGRVAGRVAIADPMHVPAGQYAREAMIHLDWYDRLEDRLIPCRDVMSALRLVEQGEAAMGIVYASNAAGNNAVDILGEFPADTHRPICYPAAVTTGASQAAKAFLQVLGGQAAREVFDAHGFTPSPAAGADPASPSTVTSPPGGDLGALYLSVKIAACCTLALLAPGLMLGWLFARREFRGKALLAGAVHVPLVIPPVATGYLLLAAFGANTPLGRWCESAMGVQLAFHWHGAVLASAVVALPLMVRSVRLAMEAVDIRLEQAAATMGAGPIRTFATVTLPLAGPGIIGGCVLAFARSLGEFGATITFADNLPDQTHTLPLAVYGYMQTPGGDAMAMKLVIVAIVLSVAAILTTEVLAARAKARLAVSI